MKDGIDHWLWLAVAIFICFFSLKFELGSLSNPGPGLFPFISALLLGLISIFFLVLPKGEKRKHGGASLGDKGFWRKRSFSVLLFLILYLFLLKKIGYLIMTFAFLSILFNIASNQKRKWWWGIGEAFITVVISYVVFDKLLQARLPKGILALYF